VFDLALASESNAVKGVINFLSASVAYGSLAFVNKSKIVFPMAAYVSYTSFLNFLVAVNCVVFKVSRSFKALSAKSSWSVIFFISSVFAVSDVFVKSEAPFLAEFYASTFSFKAVISKIC